MKGYCVKCKAKQEMKDSKTTTTSNGRQMETGTCPKCGTKINVFLPNKSK